MSISWGEGLQHVQSLTNDNFAEFVKNHMNGQPVVSLLLDVSNHNGTYKVDSYIKGGNGEHHIFSYWRRDGQEEIGATTLNPLEVEMLKSL